MRDNAPDGRSATQTSEPLPSAMIPAARRPSGAIASDESLATPPADVPSFHETAPGRYQARVGALSGAWDLTAEARAPDGAAFALERRLTWP